MKEVLFNTEGHERTLLGMKKVYDAARGTIGAQGKNAMIARKGEAPYVTKDGINTIKSIKIDDPVEDMGAQFIRQASEKTAIQTGDATTTTAILAFQMIGLGLTKITEGKKRVKLFKEMEDAVEYIEGKVKEHAVKVDEELIYSTAIISANNDKKIGSMVAEMMIKIGVSGNAVLDISTKGKDYYDVTNGMKLDSGYANAGMVNNHNHGVMAYENPLILVTDEIMSRAEQLESFWNICAANKRPGIIICPEMYGEALSTIVHNVQKQGYPLGAIIAPDHGPLSRDILEDIALYLGAELITDKRGKHTKQLHIKYLGSCDRIATTKNVTTMVGGIGNVEARVKELEHYLSETTDLKEKEDIRLRIANITGKTAIVYVHSETESEFMEKKDRLDDAVQATRAAMEEGILPGGGLFLYNRFKEFESMRQNANVDGWEVVLTACSFPLVNIIENADISIEDIDAGFTETDGYDVLSDRFVPMVSSGIVDPAKSIRVAVRNAFSAAKSFLSTHVTIVNY